MAFYRDCLGGELSLQTIGESPLAERMPDNMKSFILHARLMNGSMELMGTDMVGDQGVIRGNAVSLMLDCDSEEQIRTCYDKLSKGGRATHPLEISFWGALFGDLTDKYGNNWLLHFDKNQK
jgi:PhnB protein